MTPIILFCLLYILPLTSGTNPSVQVYTSSTNSKLARRYEILQEQYDSLVLDNSVLQMRYQQLEERLTNVEKYGNTYIVVHGGYTEWGQCDASCGGGIQSRYKICTKEETEKKTCSQTQESRSCNTHQCPGSGGATYIRYGRTQCQENGTETVYEGYVAGGHYSHTGSGVNYLCLPKHPRARIVGIKVGSPAYLYGTEYEGSSSSETLFGKGINDHDAPCALCRSNVRSSVVTFPARDRCMNGWHMEYHGFLVSSSYNHKSQKTYECLDSDPETTVSGHGNRDGALFYPVVTKIGSLPNHPYNDGEVVACAVCSK